MQHITIDVSRFLGEDGTLNEGNLLRFWRKEVMQWTNAQTLADLYNECMEEDEEISVRWIQRMEKKQILPYDEKRRWILATLLNIPPAYLGLKSIESSSSTSTEIKLLLPMHAATPVDISAYENKLREVWRAPYTILDEVLARIYVLQDALLHGQKEQRADVAHLLCEYHIAASNMQRAQGYFSSAISYLDKAVTLAQEKEYHALEVKALYMRGYSYFERWRITPNREEVRIDLLRAMKDAYAAMTLACAKQEKGVPPISLALKGAALDQWGWMLAYDAHDKRDRHAALDSIDSAAAIVNAKSFQQDPNFLQINADWLTLSKAQAYVAFGWSRSALAELSSVQGDPRVMRRYLTAHIVEAEAYVGKGSAEMGAAYAENALAVASDVRSNVHIARIKNLYDALRRHEKYKKSTDVARLGVKLLQVQHPELFV